MGIRITFPKLRRLFLFITAMAHLWACQGDLELPERAQVECESNNDCPTGYICNEALSQCVPPGQETVPPEITDFCIYEAGTMTSSCPDADGNIAQEPRRFFKEGAEVELRFWADEELGENPSVALDFPGARAPMDFVSGPDPYVYRHAIATGDDEGRVSVHLEAVDLVGNPRIIDYTNLIEVDKTAPFLSAAPTFVPMLSRDNPRQRVPLSDGELEAMGTIPVRGDTQLTIGYAFSEPMDISVLTDSDDSNGSARAVGDQGCELSVRVRCATSDGTCDGTARRNFDILFVYDDVASDAAACSVNEDSYQIALDISDAAGNVAELSLGDGQIIAPGFLLDLTPPTISTLHASRWPWLNATPGIVPASVYNDLLIDAVLEDCSDTCAQQPYGVVDIFTANSLSAYATSLLASNDVGTLGQIISGEVPTTDRVALFARAYDAAGNVTAITQVQDGTWVANVTGKLQGDSNFNPNRLTTSPQAVPFLADPRASESSTAKLGAVYNEDGEVLSTQNISPWRKVYPSEIGGSIFSSMVYMSRSGNSLLVGGQGSDYGLMGYWIWDGQSWYPMDLRGTLDPGTRFSTSLAYDSQRDRVVMTGGSLADLDSAQVWEWDGRDWFKAGGSADGEGPVMILSPMAYDAGRGQSLVAQTVKGAFGGGSCDDNVGVYIAALGTCIDSALWGWDGIAWSELCSEATGCTERPPARLGHGLAYDPNTDLTYLFGGFSCLDDDCTANPDLIPRDDLWAWDGSAWTELAPTNTPPARGFMVMSAAPNLGGIIVHGGCQGLNPAGEFLDCLEGGEAEDVWILVGGEWGEITGLSFAPKRRMAGAGVYDNARRQLLLKGGQLVKADSGSGDMCSVFETPESITEAYQSRPSADAYCNLMFTETYGLSFAGVGLPNWQRLAGTDPVPHAQRDMGMSYDAQRKVSVLFGGGLSDNLPEGCQGDGVRACTGLWEWNGQSWQEAWRYTPKETMTDPLLDAEPCPREAHAQANLQSGGTSMTLIVGGQRASDMPGSYSTHCSDTSAWGWTGPTEPATDGWFEFPGLGFSNVYGAAAAVDDAVYYFGGVLDPFGTPALSDELWLGQWDGTSGLVWSMVTPASGTRPQARSQHTMAYDPLSGKIYLYGGCSALYTAQQPNETRDCDPNGGFREDFWAYDPGTNTWEEITPATTSPGPLAQHTMTYDSNRARILIHGGQSPSGFPSSPMWQWDGNDWSPLPLDDQSPGNPRLHVMSFHPETSEALVLGDSGIGEIWLRNLDPDARPSAVFEVAWDAAGIDQNLYPSAKICELRFDFYGAAAGADVDLDLGDGIAQGAPITGLEPSLWSASKGGWQYPSASACSTLGSGEGSRCVLTDSADAVIEDFLLGQAPKFYLRITPAAGNGNGAQAAQLDVDYVAAEVDYALDGICP